MKRPIDTMIERANAKRLKIAVIGDALVDQYIHGRVEWGQEDCPKFVEESRVSVPGGAANAARSLENWNADVNLLCGMPDFSSVKTRFLVHGKYVFRHDIDEECTLTQEDRDFALSRLQGWKPDAVLLSDYDKGTLTPEFIRRVIDYANERKIPVVVDAKRHPRLYEGSILKGNQAYCEKYHDESAYNFKGTVLTYGEKPPHVYPMAGKVKVQNHPVVVKNHVGAGDTFAAHLTLALAHGMSLEDAACIAHSAGRCYVQKMHNEPPTVDDIRKDMGVE